MAGVRRILFVCMGNICRSPMGEALLKHHATELGLDDVHVDSAGVGGWHAGESPDHRMQQTARQYGIIVEGQARKIRKNDLVQFDLILCSDVDILDQVLALGSDRSRTKLMLDYHPERAGEDVPDPYYGGSDGFKDVFEMLNEACRSLVETIRSGHL